MDAPKPFQCSPEDTNSQIMQASYEALRKHGYSDLTVQRIGDEFPKSKSLIYQHYDGKDELLVALLEFLLEQLKTNVPTDDFDDAHEHLKALIEHTVPASFDSEHTGFMGAVAALRGQAPHDDAYREQFAKISAFHREHVADIIRNGIDQGVFRDVDPEQSAAFLTTAIHGVRNQRVTTGNDEPVETLRRELFAYIRIRLLTDTENGQ
ncbi:TetR/AcrR family transcriptional regulator [Halocatena pleomorpha]|uniref:TetR family transcriptional regulator n=1 Tax=Halocatena pleomorpha TaxID=1785090 RepID=A0A3P3RDJ2_9EURY|nr:TetR/AcrR family transcriptional regulator [Halocatena pleomorpha]RRJ31572.1 TetR family transcriptional regulator [Halocatena pleomorpha]